MTNTEISRSKSYGIAVVAYSCNNLVHCECCCCLPTPMTLASGGSPIVNVTANINGFRLIYLDNSRVSREGVYAKL